MLAIAFLAIFVMAGYFYFQSQLAQTTIRQQAEKLKTQGKANYRMNKQIRELQTLAANAQVQALTSQHQYYSITKSSVLVNEFNSVDSDQLMNILHTVICNNGFYGHRDNVRVLLEMLYGVKRNEWPRNLQHNDRLPEGYAVAWIGSSVHPPAQIYNVIISFEQKQESNGHNTHNIHN